MAETDRKSKSEDRWAVIFVKFALAEGGRLMAFATIVWGFIYVLATPAIQSYMVKQLHEAPGFERLLRDEAQQVGLATTQDVKDLDRVNTDQQAAIEGLLKAQSQMQTDQVMQGRAIEKLATQMDDVKKGVSDIQLLSNQILLTLKNK